MTKGTLTWVLAAAIGGAAMVAGHAAAADAPATQPTTKPAKGARHRKLTQPYSEMKTLTEQQSDQIAKIHEDALEQTKKVKEKETDDIESLLTPDQKAELEQIEGKKAADRKAAMPTKRKRGDAATTLPAK